MLFTIQDDHLDEAEMDRIKQASFDSMFTHCKTFEGHSNWMVNDLSHSSKFIACDPFEAYELLMGKVGWIGMEYQQINTNDYGIVSAAQEDTDHHHGSVVTLYKKDTSISADDLDDFIDCMAEYVKVKDTVEFFDETVLALLAGAEDEHVIDLVKRIEKQVGIIQKRKSKDIDRTRACKVLWKIWFHKDEITGIFAITRSVRQERALNIEMIDSPLQRKIKADMRHDFEWKKGPLGTVVFVSCPMYLIHYDDARNSPLPAHMPGKFWSCGSEKRFINKAFDYSGAAIQVIEERKWKPEKRRRGHKAEDYKVKLLLKLNEYDSRMYIECQLGRAINKGVDSHVQLLLNHPNVHQYAMENNLDYYWGVDEFAKLYARQHITAELEKCQKKLAKQKKKIDELEKYKQKHEKESDESDEVEIDENDDDDDEDEIDENKNKKKNSGEIHADDDDEDVEVEIDESDSDSDLDKDGNDSSESDSDEDEDIAESTARKTGDKEEVEG